jgi:signal transduction histidine kinase
MPGSTPKSDTDQRKARGPGAKPLILVVDDEEPMRDSCRQVLERAGCQVAAVCDGASALEAIACNCPEVVLLDLRMPGMPGEEFLRRARGLDPELVAVAVTGYPTLSSAIDVMKAGAYDYLPKPFKAEELRIIIQRALQKRRLAMAVAVGEREKRLMQDNFAAMVSHQLKSPAATVRECLDSALVAFGDKVPEGCRDLMERAARKASLLLDLMDDWLTLARVESGGLRPQAERMDLRDVLRQAIQAARSDPEANHLTVSLEAPDDPVPSRGDPEALRELFVNLVTNALRYTPDGGRVAVRLERQGPAVLVSVADTGPGIPQSEQPLIFEPFFRGEQARKRHGTGLGLAIAKQIAEAHGGHISVESEPGRGATFRVHLPAGEEGR